MLTLTAMKVPGRNMRVKMVMTCIESVSCLVLMAISCILCVHFIISSLEVLATSCNASDVRTLANWINDSDWTANNVRDNQCKPRYLKQSATHHLHVICDSSREIEETPPMSL